MTTGIYVDVMFQIDVDSDAGGITGNTRDGRNFRLYAGVNGQTMPIKYDVHDAISLLQRRLIG